jgi:hypothetical protein
MTNDPTLTFTPHSLYPGSWEEHFIRMGAMALGAFTMATVLSLKPIRHFAYEFFLVAHIALIL